MVPATSSARSPTIPIVARLLLVSLLLIACGCGSPPALAEAPTSTTPASPEVERTFGRSGSRVAILADIHSNLEALSAVLADAESRGAQRIVVCGDIVGYGANPNEVIALLREKKALAVLGDWDAMALGKLELENAKETEGKVLSWTRSQLSTDSRQYLESLPEYLDVGSGIVLGHGTTSSQRDLIIDLAGARKSLKEMEERWPEANLFCFGHSHLSMYLGPKARRVEETDKFKRLELQVGKRYLLNPGSVGQPRDRDWRSSYALFTPETRELEFQRIEYEVATAQEKIIDAKLPPTHALRLQYGI